MPIPSVSSKFVLLVALLVVGPMTGCVPWARGIRSLDDTVTDWRDFVWGKRAFYQRYGFSQSGPFRDGFLEGYHDILQGGDGCLPVVPPRRYWSWRYQSAGGQTAVSDWFNGYSAGVDAAKADGLSNLYCVPMSSQYNGTSTVPIESMPNNSEEWGPIESIEPKTIPAPSVEPPGPSTIDSNPKETTQYNSRRSEVRPATAVQPTSQTSYTEPQPRAIGSGTSQDMPLMVIPSHSIPAESVMTSRRSSETPYPLGPTPIVDPSTIPAGLPAAGSDVPLPVQRQTILR